MNDSKIVFEGPGPLFPVWVKSRDKWGYIDVSGRMVIEPMFDKAQNFSDGMSRIMAPDGRYGFIDESGRQIIPPCLEEAGSFSDGLATATIDGQNCYIDKSGRVVLYSQHEVNGPFYDGLAMVRSASDKNRMCAFIDKTGAYVIKPVEGNLRFAWRFTEGLAWFEIPRTNKWGYINRSGGVAIDAKFDDYAGEFSEGLAEVRLGWIDRSGHYVISAEDYDFEMHPEGKFSEGLAPFSSRFGKRRGFVDKSGEIVLDFSCYAGIHEFAEGLARVTVLMEDGSYKYGFIDKSGLEVIPPIYDSAWDFVDGLAEIEMNGMPGYINKKGETVYLSE